MLFPSWLNGRQTWGPWKPPAEDGRAIYEIYLGLFGSCLGDIHLCIKIPKWHLLEQNITFFCVGDIIPLGCVCYVKLIKKSFTNFGK